jgi:putative transposase
LSRVVKGVVKRTVPMTLCPKTKKGVVLLPRIARQISKTNIYHVMLRGNERKNIFADAEDKARFIDTVYHKREDNGFCLYAYCVMDNHVHLVIKELKDSISRIMKRIGTSYATYFNKKYKRVGHVFQDRYKSEPIENERYLLSVIRYVHNNPVQAGICKIQDYKWSSYKFYIQEVKEQERLVEYEEILNYFSEDRNRAIILFKEFSSQESNDNFIDVEDNMLDEEETLEYVNDYLATKKIPLEYLKQREYKRERDMLVKELIEKSRLSLRKISEILGLSRETVRRISVSKEPSL